MTSDDHRSRPGRDLDGAEGPDAVGGPDPVADFFASERAQVRPLAADDLRWQRITREHRTRAGSWRRYAAAAAAVVVIGGGVGLVTSLRHDPVTPTARPTVTRTVYVQAPTTPPASTVTPAPATSRAVVPPPSMGGGPTPSTRVPSDFTVVSLTTVASGRMFALGSASCAGGPCALLATSGDRGVTWALRGRVPGLTASPRLSATPSTPGSAVVGSGSGVTDVRFADDHVGWVFGRTVVRTTDGGRSWAPYGHAGSGPVLALETDGSDVVLATAASCGTPSCTGAVRVSRAGVGATSAPAVGLPLLLGQGYLGLDVAWRQGTAVVSVRAGSQDPPASVVRGSAVSTLTMPDCGTTSGATSLAAPSDGSGLVVVCGVAAPGSRLGPVFTGDGASWTRVADAGPGLAAGSLLSVAAVDPRHLVVAAGGTAGSRGALAVTADAGRTWHAPADPSAPVGGFAWVGSPGGRTFYALPARTGGSFWRSDDAGETWTAVAVR